MSAEPGPLIRPCAGICGRMTRNTRTPKSAYPDTVARVVGDRCRTCIRAMAAAADDNPAAKEAEEARKARISAERLAAAETARNAFIRERIARRQLNTVRRVRLGQSEVRI